MSDLPHVTDILRDAGLIDTTWFTQEARDRGTAVHAAIHYLLDGDLDRDTLDPAIEPIVAAFVAWAGLDLSEVIACEMHLDDMGLGYQGRPDLICRRPDGKVWIIDYKCGAPAPWHGAQLAAYLHAYGQEALRANLYLTNSGYKFVPRTDRDDWKVFQAALTLHNWRAKWQGK